MPALLADNQVALQTIEIAQQEISRQHSADVTEVIVETDDIQAFVRFEVVGLLGEEGQLHRITQIGVAHAAYAVRDAKPLIGVQCLIAKVIQVLNRKFVSQNGCLPLQASNNQPGLVNGKFLCCYLGCKVGFRDCHVKVPLLEPALKICLIILH